MPTSDVVKDICCRLVALDLSTPSRWADAALYCLAAARTAETTEDAHDLQVLADYYRDGCLGRPVFATPARALAPFTQPYTSRYTT